MSRINYAAIDIGSNAVRLFIKSISSEAVGKQQFKKILLLRIPFVLDSTFSAMANFLSVRLANSNDS